MQWDDLLLKGTAWLALICYTAGELALRRTRKALILNSIGCASLLIHIIFVFHYRHNWSHSHAYADTARQTAALTGWNSGAGLYLNYLFAVVWSGMVARAWIGPTTPESARVARKSWLIRALFLFMFVNAAFIFAASPLRWIGLVCCVLLVVAWVKRSSPAAS